MPTLIIDKKESKTKTESQLFLFLYQENINQNLDQSLRSIKNNISLFKTFILANHN